MQLIFCPTCDTLLLDAPACPACGWRRPPELGDAGKQLWRAEPGRALPRAQGSAAIAGGRFCVAADDGTIVALDLASGQVAWERAIDPGRLRHTLASDGARLFVGSADMQALPTAGTPLLALDPADGATVWEHPTAAHSLSGAAADRGMVFFSSSDGMLHAVDAASGAGRWAARHGAWAAETPAAGDGIVCAGGRESTLIGYSAGDGAQLWRFTGGGMFAGPIRLTGGAIYACCWDGRLYALDARTGALRWQLDPERGEGVTSAPAIAGGRVFVGSRVYRDQAARAGNVYALLALDAATGAELWRFVTEKHISAAPAATGDLALFGADDGTFQALDAATGQVRWQSKLDTRVVTQPLIDGDTLLIGTRAGAIQAIRWRARPAERAETPQAYWQRGEPEQAAAAYALGGDLASAAAIYERELAQPRRAAQLYERAGQPAQAARLWEQAGDLRRARELYQQAGNTLDLARLWAEAGDLLRGARLYEDQAALVQAAELYERAGDRAKAAELYAKGGRREQARQIWQSLGEWERLAGALIEDQQFAAAADLLAQHQQAERAAELYERAGQLARALELRAGLRHWERAVDLASRLGDDEQAGLAYERLSQPAQAAEAYQRAADRLAAAAPRDEPRVAGLYERAMQLYAAAFDDERATICRRQARRYRHLPEIVVTGGAQQVFVEYEWNTLLVRVENVGHGPANTIDVALRGPFDIRGNETIGRLPAQRTHDLSLFVRPHRDEYGPKVPLEIAVSYSDAQGERYQGAQSLPIHVVQKGAAVSAATPLEIHVEDDQMRPDPSRPGQPSPGADPSSGPAFTADQEAVAQQELLLSAHRRTLHHLLGQMALLGSMYAPPGLLNGIDEARAEIGRIKALLRGWGVAVPDHPDDRPMAG
jgi:outer membrane protein assembly factor BamB/tetratricopeptide (TPR) repeat protein